MKTARHDVVVLGAGPGGYVAAIRAAQLGLDVACIDENQQLGGTCLRIGCIPSKALLESSHLYLEATKHLGDHGIEPQGVKLDLAKMLARKDKIVGTLTGGIGMLFKKNKVTPYIGRGRFTDPGTLQVEGDEPVQVSADSIIIATGSRPASMKSVEEDGDLIGNSTAALKYDSVPQRLIVIGGGYIGLELGSVWNRLGSETIVLEALDRILPGMDAEIGKLAHRTFERQGLKFQLGSWVESARIEDGKPVVRLRDAEPITADRVLLATGRVPATEGLGLANVGLESDSRGFLAVDQDFQTSTKGVYAIGDCIGGAMLAHKAMEEGVACVERMVGMGSHVNYDVIPAIVYTHPEIASVGKTEEQLNDQGVAYRKGVCPYAANGRARTLGEAEGRVKILAAQDTDRVLGVHIIGARAGDLIAEAAAAMEFGASAEDIARTCHAHPTLSEIMHEAALATDGRPIHTA